MVGPRTALIVANDSYTDPGLRRLRAPASDARALTAVLSDPEIGSFEVRTLLNEPAHMIKLAIEEHFADRAPGDLLVVYFSCHGIKDEDGELYFAAPNTVLGRLGATAVEASFVSRCMNRTRSRRVVLFLDCCYAGAFERGLVARAGTDIGIEDQLAGRGRAVITASSAMEYAFEAGELTKTCQVPPSVFTSALVEGLETGEADRDQDGRIGLDELYSYVYDKVRAATPNQTPGKWILGMEGELYIARRRHPVATPAHPPSTGKSPEQSSDMIPPHSPARSFTNIPSRFAIGLVRAVWVIAGIGGIVGFGSISGGIVALSLAFLWLLLWMVSTAIVDVTIMRRWRALVLDHSGFAVEVPGLRQGRRLIAGDRWEELVRIASSGPPPKMLLCAWVSVGESTPARRIILCPIGSPHFPISEILATIKSYCPTVTIEPLQDQLSR
jgi:hypothetical protein